MGKRLRLSRLSAVVRFGPGQVAESGCPVVPPYVIGGQRDRPGKPGRARRRGYRVS